MSERVEAAAKAIHESGDWDVPWSEDGWRADCARAEATNALSAADAVMFSEAAIERAAKEIFALNFDPITWAWISHENDRQSCSNLARAVVAALREES